jgi:lipid II:glycine glycyltransferase (peptidoglycan interpeptide bridge formation enzyme)
MTFMEILPDLTPAVWDPVIAHLPGAHILQTAAWGQFKAHYGWQPMACLWRPAPGAAPCAAALVLHRAVRAGLSVLYVPRGPLLDWAEVGLRTRVLDDLQALARARGAIFIKIDPELVTGWGVPDSSEDRPDEVGEAGLTDLRRRGWLYSNDQIQFRNTVWIDLQGDEVSWLARMKQKTRYNIRLAERKGVRVRSASLDELPLLYRLYAETSVRDGFVIRPESYYLALWQSFMQQGLVDPLLAEVVDPDHPSPAEPVAGLILFHFAGRAWYLHGMSRSAHRERMPTYLLQWEAMRRAKAAGARLYDLWGAPEAFNERDSMWGVFRFKEGLGGQVVRTLGAWDFPARPLLYTLYTRLLPRVLNIMRRRGQARTRQEVAL